MNKKIIIPIVIILLIIAGGGVFWWWQKSAKELPKETKKNSSVTETTSATGKVVLPTGINPKNFTIVGLATTSSPDKDGNFTAKKIYKEGITVVAAVPEKEEFGLPLESVVIASKGSPEKPMVLNFESTAVSSVFNTPYLMTNDPKKAKEILKVIENDPKVKDFAKVLKKVFFTKDPLDNPVYQKAYKEAVESVLSTLNP